jgi:hypothetical protein
LLGAIKAIARRNHRGYSKEVSLFMEAEQRYVINLFLEEGMKGVEIIPRLNKHYGKDALQRTQVYCWIKKVKTGRQNLSNLPPPGRTSDEGLDDCIAKALKEDPHPSTREIVRAMDISLTMVQNHLTKSLVMKCCYM